MGLDQQINANPMVSSAMLEQWKQGDEGYEKRLCPRCFFRYSDLLTLVSSKQGSTKNSCRPWACESNQLINSVSSTIRLLASWSQLVKSLGTRRVTLSNPLGFAVLSLNLSSRPWAMAKILWLQGIDTHKWLTRRLADETWVRSEKYVLDTHKRYGDFAYLCVISGLHE